MMLELIKEVIFVEGPVRGAIYDLNANQIYSIDQEACEVIKALYENKTIDDDDQIDFVNHLIDNRLYDPEMKIRSYQGDDTINEPEYNIEFAWLELTQSCNLKCIHCYEGEQHACSKNELTKADWMSIIDDLSKRKIKKVILIGGEPSIYRDVDDIIRYLTKKNIDTILFTNATLLSDELKQTIIDHNVYLKVSIYGNDAQTHDGITMVNGSFHRVISNVKELLKEGVKVEASIIAMKENQDNIEKTIQFVRNIGMIYYRYDVIRQVFGGHQNNHLPSSQFLTDKTYYQKPRFNISKQRFIDGMSRNTCWYGKLAISDNGEVLPCVFARNISYGNIKEEGLANILAGEKLKSYWHFTFSEVDVCKDCEYRFACKDCRPVAMGIDGNLYAKNPKCLYDPFTGQWNKLKSMKELPNVIHDLNKGTGLNSL